MKTAEIKVWTDGIDVVNGAIIETARVVYINGAHIGTLYDYNTSTGKGFAVNDAFEKYSDTRHIINAYARDNNLQLIYCGRPMPTHW